MKTRLIIMLIAISISSAFAQTDSLTFKKDIDKLNSKISELESMIEIIQTTNKQVQLENSSLKNSQSVLKKNYKQLSNDFDNYKIHSEAKIDSIHNLISTNSANIDKTANELGVKIESTEKSTKQSITDLNKTVSQNTLYWIIAVLVVTLFVLLVFVLLRKQIFKQKIDLISNLEDTRKGLEEEGVKLDNKLIEVLETQLKIINNANSNKNKEVVHTLTLKVADEIIRMQTNMSLMDEKTKGLKKLKSAVKRIQDNFAANGYELIEMLGKPYNEGMKVTIVNSKTDENLKKGEQIITRIIKPQIDYQGVMIQSAQIEVSQGA